MDRLVLGIPLSNWILAAVECCLVAAGIPVLREIVRRRCPIADPSARSWRGLVGSLNARWMRPTTWFIALGCATLSLATDQRVVSSAKFVLIAVLTFQIIRLVPVLVDWTLLRWTKSERNGPQDAVGTIVGLRWLVLLVAYAIILLAALQNTGVDVTSLIAGLGIGGIAVALAMQNILGDLFASLTIALDKPFIVGDFIVVGSEMGTVEHVGLKTTRVRSLSGEQLVFGNADLLSSRIRNYKRMSERRVVFGFSVVYGTPVDTLQAIGDMVRRVVEGHDTVRFDRCHLHRFGSSSLDFETVYYINSPDYNTHMDVQQAVHLSIAREFKERGIEFAFPTQMLYVVPRTLTPALP